MSATQSAASDESVFDFCWPHKVFTLSCLDKWGHLSSPLGGGLVNMATFLRLELFLGWDCFNKWAESLLTKSWLNLETKRLTFMVTWQGFALKLALHNLNSVLTEYCSSHVWGTSELGGQNNNFFIEWLLYFLELWTVGGKYLQLKINCFVSYQCPHWFA